MRRLLILCIAVLSASPLQAGRPVDLPTAITGGLDYLMRTQNDDGSWGSCRNITSVDMGFAPSTYISWKYATCALATQCLMRAKSTPERKKAALKGLQYLTIHWDQDRGYNWDIDNVWALVYGTTTLGEALNTPGLLDDTFEPEVRKAAGNILKQLLRYQSPVGGWGYYTNGIAYARPEWATSFTTAAAVLGLVECRKAGLEVPDKHFDAAIRGLQRSRLPDGCFQYTISLSGVPPRYWSQSVDRLKGSLGRIPTCLLALQGGDAAQPEAEVIRYFDNLVKHNKFLRIALHRPYPHEAYYQNANYFYLFGYHYAARLLATMPPDVQKRARPTIVGEILRTRQKDGSFWDAHLLDFGRAYGTAFAVMGLIEIDSASD